MEKMHKLNSFYNPKITVGKNGIIKIKQIPNFMQGLLKDTWKIEVNDFIKR